MAHIGKVLVTGFVKLLIDKKWRNGKYIFFLDYCKYTIKYVVSWKLLHIPLHFEQIGVLKLHFFHYSIFLSLFEDMFLNDEYYVKLQKKPTIFDLGSEIGFSVCYFKSLYPNAKITAFEPDPASFKLLVENVKRNLMKNVTTYNVALSNKQGVLPFYIDSKVDGSLTMSLSAKRQRKKISVKVDRLSRFITQKIDLLKMDIEGAELSVINDLVDSKKISFVQNMIVEYHHHIDSQTNNLSFLLKLLEKSGLGYQIQAKYNLPFQKKQYQDLLIFAYKE